MATAITSHWMVRFPLNFYAQFSDKIKGKCLIDHIHPSIVGQRFEDVSFEIKNECDWKKTIENLRETLDAIADDQGLEILHAPQVKMSSFELKYSDNGKPEIKFD